MIFCFDALQQLKLLTSSSINTCVTSPPYYNLRNYGVDGQIGLESTPEAYIKRLLEVFSEVKRVLRDDGTLWIVISDSYAGSGKNTNNSKPHKKATKTLEHLGDCVPSGIVPDGLKPKDLIGIPWLLAFALRADGWYWRDTIIWHKPNCMPESVKDRCTKSHEYILLFSKNRQYYYDSESVMEPTICKTVRKFIDNNSDKQRGHSRKHAGFNGRYAERLKLAGVPNKRNKRSVWSVPTKPYKEAHFAVYPPELIEPCILAGCPIGGTVLDPFMGSGTTGEVALMHSREFVGIELNMDYVKLAEKRLKYWEQVGD